MKAKTNIEFFHTAKESANELAQFFGWLEMHEWEKCRFYSFDDDAFENNCSCPDLKRKGDFEPHTECWQCTKRKVRGKP